MGWVTLDDGQHVYISSGGKVLATRGAISSGPGGGKERGKALAARSKAAMNAAINRTTLGTLKSDSGRKAKEEEEYKANVAAFQAKTAKINRVGTRVEQALKQAKAAREAKGLKRASLREKILDSRLNRVVRQMDPNSRVRSDSPATARAIEHARAAVTGKTPDWIKGKTQGADENWKSLRQRTQQNQQYNQMTMKRRGMTTAQLVAKLKAAR